MMLSISKTHKGKKKIGRPVTHATPVMVRLYPEHIEALDDWIIRQREVGLGRPAAIRRLLEMELELKK